ncbi:hypothetical protein M409DRAFT_67805 [Zasmidium cellare ATCC 36951]|uniref:FCP1 homology domain-containing protein n=1 Tax=Zasmidium cellare ATCC 36951 TaxID=1080233 RepID=A0A6A6CEN5_ZASCE|nr:uncharacterized protein M409DRAFT_67805 [Zasmidium cellare ATCC 36951]KAF2164700.1 hypothetical protein M409DRAFT_67805 [Zasmidium cellare ATCC 36951]
MASVETLITSSSTPSQAFVPPPRTSSREVQLTQDWNSVPNAASSGQPNPSDATALPIPEQPTSAQQSSSPQERSESIGRGSRRSIKKGSKRKDQESEKAPQAPSAEQERPKKKGGLLAFLNCCGSSDTVQETGQQDAAQPAKPATKTQPTRAQQPRNPQNVGTADTSTTQDSKEVIDEKSTQKQLLADGSKVESRKEGADAEKSQPSDGAVDKLEPNHPGGSLATATANSSGVAQSADGSSGLPNIVTSGPSDGPVDTDPANPSVQVQAPTPTVPQQEDQPIFDRTPEQKQLDEDIEMSDKLPLSEKEAQQIDEEQHQHQTEESQQGYSTGSLPPPPPLPQSHQGSGDSTGASHDTSLVSTPEQSGKWLLPPVRPEHRGRKCLVLDLDETLVHSSFKILHQADFTIPVEIEGQYHNVYVIKRPGVDQFLKRVGELYEVVVFTASVSKYGDPLLDQLDIHGVVHHRLFRESCYNHQGNYVKDLSQIGRDLKETIIIDNSPTSYIFHPQHAVPISSWFSDAHDNELLDLIPVLYDLAGSQVQDVSLVLDVAL